MQRRESTLPACAALRLRSKTRVRPGPGHPVDRASNERFVSLTKVQRNLLPCIAPLIQVDRTGTPNPSRAGGAQTYGTQERHSTSPDTLPAGREKPGLSAKSRTSRTMCTCGRITEHVVSRRVGPSPSGGRRGHRDNGVVIGADVLEQGCSRLTRGPRRAVGGTRVAVPAQHLVLPAVGVGVDESVPTMPDTSCGGIAARPLPRSPRCSTSLISMSALPSPSSGLASPAPTRLHSSWRSEPRRATRPGPERCVPMRFALPIRPETPELRVPRHAIEQQWLCHSTSDAPGWRQSG